jgi:hypothetical protein
MRPGPRLLRPTPAAAPSSKLLPAAAAAAAAGRAVSSAASGSSRCAGVSEHGVDGWACCLTKGSHHLPLVGGGCYSPMAALGDGSVLFVVSHSSLLARLRPRARRLRRGVPSSLAVLGTRRACTGTAEQAGLARTCTSGADQRLESVERSDAGSMHAHTRATCGRYTRRGPLPRGRSERRAAREPLSFPRFPYHHPPPPLLRLACERDERVWLCDCPCACARACGCRSGR